MMMLKGDTWIFYTEHGMRTGELGSQVVRDRLEAGGEQQAPSVSAYAARGGSGSSRAAARTATHAVHASDDSVSAPRVPHLLLATSRPTAVPTVRRPVSGGNAREARHHGYRDGECACGARPVSGQGWPNRPGVPPYVCRAWVKEEESERQRVDERHGDVEALGGHVRDGGQRQERSRPAQKKLVLDCICRPALVAPLADLGQDLCNNGVWLNASSSRFRFIIHSNPRHLILMSAMISTCGRGRTSLTWRVAPSRSKRICGAARLEASNA